MKYLILFILLPLVSVLEAQDANVINTAVPILRLTPDARAAAMGDAGIATSPDAHSIFWNTAKLAFIQNRFGISTTYTPLINGVGSDIFLFDASAYWKIDSNNAITGSIRYFNFGEITYKNTSGIIIKTIHPNEYTLHLGYARKLARGLSAGINLGYVHSYLAEGYGINNDPIVPGKSLMADISLFYTHPVKGNSLFKNYDLGLTISNLGGKITYFDSQPTGDFLPANLGLGSNFNFQFGKDHQLALALDLNKLLVPTPDSAGTFRDESVVAGVFKSFADAPGGAHEELREINVSIGAEYWWRKMIALRTGYFYESKYKGNRQYFCLGGGIKCHMVEFDLSYLIRSSPLENPGGNMLRLGLSFNFNSFRSHSMKNG